MPTQGLIFRGFCFLFLLACRCWIGRGWGRVHLLILLLRVVLSRTASPFFLLPSFVNRRRVGRVWSPVPTHCHGGGRYALMLSSPCRYPPVGGSSIPRWNWTASWRGRVERGVCPRTSPSPRPNSPPVSDWSDTVIVYTPNRDDCALLG